MIEKKNQKEPSGGMASVPKSRSLRRKRITVAVTAGVLAFLTAGLLVAQTLITKLASDEQSASTPPEYISDIGESYYGNTVLAYPSFTQSAVEGVVVGSHKGNYAIYRSDDKQYFYFCYEGENGEMQVYYPNIVSAESGFDYSSLYAVEQGDGLNVYKITYLLAALGTLAVDQRITLSADDYERRLQLNRYGFGPGEVETIYIFAKDKDGKEIEHMIEIGDSLLAGTGYYYRIDNRDYVYTSNGTYLSYALGGFEGFISPNLVAEGLPEDGVYEPYYTTGYNQWKNKVTKYDEKLSAELQALVKENSRVVVYADRHTPIYDDTYYEKNGIDKSTSDGYASSGTVGVEFNLASLSLIPQYNRLTGLFKTARLGDYTESPLLVTVISDTLAIDFGEGDAVSYEYRIQGVESVLTDSYEYGAGDGYAKVSDVPGATALKVAYSYYIGGEKKNEVMRHGIVRLDELSADTAAALLDCEIGAAADITFTENYTKDTADQHGITYVVSEIAMILSADATGFDETVTENSTVTIRYYMKANGSKISEEQSATFNMADMKEGSYLKLKEALLGKTVGKNLEIEGYTDVIYTQRIADFVTYEIEKITSFVESEMIAAFEFVNPSERDSFHGESVYKNTLPKTNKYSNYALSSTACTNVLGLLGGIGLNTDSNHSEGLVGSETVAIGITAEKMEKYGLYANTVYFEIPRNIVKIKHDDPDKLDDISYFATLGFTLYISDYDYEEDCRYIASDMYDVIVKVEGNDFEYLDISFVDFWATRNVALVNYKNIDKLTADFYLDDFSGSCEFDVTAETVYIANGEIFLSRPEGISSTKKDIIAIDLSASGNLSSGANPSNLIQYLAATGKESVTIKDFYNAVASAELGYQVDLSTDETSLGASCFQDMLLLMFNTYYLGTLSAEEQAVGKECKKLMTLTFEVKGSERDTYTYDFYRIDDRRVMVSLYNPGYSNEVTDFYITTFAFKKMIYGFECLFNGQEIDFETVYN